MRWKYSISVQEHQLVYQESVLARIQMLPKKRGGYKVTTLISGIYFGAKKQKYLEKRNREWVAYRKKFHKKENAERYISRKKAEVLRFIKAREKEG